MEIIKKEPTKLIEYMVSSENYSELSMDENKIMRIAKDYVNNCLEGGIQDDFYVEICKNGKTYKKLHMDKIFRCDCVFEINEYGEESDTDQFGNIWCDPDWIFTVTDWRFLDV